MAVRSLLIDGVEIALPSLGMWSQTYRRLGGRAELVLASGSIIVQNTWERLETKIAAAGWIPAALTNLNSTSAVSIGCAAPRGVSAATPFIILPAARRSGADYAPIGQAVVGGELLLTPCNVVGNTAILDPVADATSYRVLYWPQFMAVCSPVEESTDIPGAEYGWTLRAREA